MLLLAAFIEVLPKDRDAIHSAFVDVVASTRAEEGCEEYGCYEETQQRERYVFIERGATRGPSISTSRRPTWRHG